MSDDERVPVIFAKRERDLVADGIKPYPGSIVGYCEHCRVPIRLSPKSQKTMKNKGAKAYCPSCMETQVLANMKDDDDIVFYGRDPKDLQRMLDAAHRKGFASIPLGHYKADVCIPCACGNHDQCEGQTCGCSPCQTDGPVAGL